MNKLLILTVLLYFFAGKITAQKKTNQINLGPEIGIRVGTGGEPYTIGVGVIGKYLHGISEAGQLSFTTGYLLFPKEDEFSGESFKRRFSVIPVLIGYRHYFNDVYIEPQLGFGSYGEKTSGFSDGSSTSLNKTTFSYAFGAGLVRDKIDLSIRFQEGDFQFGNFSFFGFRVAYNISTGKKQ
ncbi:MAG: hypothetical protein K2X48_04850 [Chitinophagaceae bacterium]|nr:hypothetical protein [Chitinophagaceae bacterium]